jgi:hypothetical protein
MDKIDRLIQTVRYLKEEGGMVTGSIANVTNKPGEPINIAGLPPDSPPVDLRKGRRRYWNPFFKELVGMFRRKSPKK